MSGLANLASIVSAGATCVALLFAGLELRRSRKDDQRRRRVEIEGVAVSWVPVEVPRTAQDADGQASWVYAVTAYNPGSLPISDVRVEIQFALKVRRVHYDGHLDDPVDRILLDTPVIIGGGERAWRRRLLLNYAEGVDTLPRTQATISFINPDDPCRKQQNFWPKRLPAASVHDAAQSTDPDNDMNSPFSGTSGSQKPSPREGGPR